MEWKEDRFKLSSDEWTALYEQNQSIILKTGIYWVVFVETGQAAAADGEIEKIHSDNFKE